MSSENKITIESITKNLNNDELIKLSEKYGLNTKGFILSKSTGLLRYNLKKKMIKQLKESIHRHKFISLFNSVLSHETKLKIFPDYEQYIERKQREEVERKQREEVERKQREEAERKQREEEDFINKLIEERKNELANFSLDKINSSPFTDKINSIKATVEKQLRKLRELRQLEEEWRTEQEKQEQIAKEYERDYEVFYSLPSEKQIYEGNTKHVEFMNVSNGLIPSLFSEPKKRMNDANIKPFGTEIKLDKLDDDELKEMGALLKDFYETNIKTMQLNSKILVCYFIDGEWLKRPLDNPKIRASLEKMLNGNFVFTVDEITTNVSDPKLVNLSLSFIDAIKFEIVNDNKAKNERSGNASGFFPYRLNKDWKWFKVFTRELQIGTKLYSFKNKSPKKWLKSNCLIYAIERLYPDETVMLEELSRKLNGIKYIDSYHLTEIANIFSIKFIVYTKDTTTHKTVKGNVANGGKYGSDDAKYTVEIARFEHHYFIYKEFPVSAFFIKHYIEIIKEKPIENIDDFLNRCLIYERRPNGSWKTNKSKSHISSLNMVCLMFECGAFTPLYRSDRDVDLACVHEWTTNEKKNDSIDNIEKFNYKMIAPNEKQPNERRKEHIIYYADFETCSQNVEYNGIHTKQEKAFMVCVQSLDGSEKKTFKGFDCAMQLMEYLPNNAVVYFHNLGFDGRLLMKHGVKSNIMKGSKIITQKHEYKGKHITFKDSYSVFPQKLASFPKAFKNEFKGLSIQKELFPYRYYSYNRICGNGIGRISECGNDELPQWTTEQREQFKANIDSIPGCRLDDDKFDMMLYCEFYCQQDVNVLRIGFNAFRESALKPPIEMDIFEITTAPSLANEYLNKNVFYPNGNLYQYSGKLQDYIMGAVYGGRCMTKQNKRWIVDDKILDDFDACSLYPSAMARLFTVEGLPHPIPKHLLDDHIYSKQSPHYYLQHAFTEDQTEPTEERFISYGIFDIEIVHVGINRDFPLIVKRDNETNTNMNVNENINMRVDLLQLEDLAHFQKIAYKIKGGIYWSGKRDHRIREVIKKLYNQRAQYKKEGNSIQEVIKLIMNSGYGKSIQKPIKTDTKFIHESKLNHYIYEHFHNLDTIKKVSDSDTWMITLNKTLEKQYNNCVFGVSVLSMSKRIMNEVMCLAEDLHINIYYQDTDSMHIEHSKLEQLATEYKKLYNRELIGENIMGRFHNDFDELKNAYCVFHLSLGKKMYYDELANDDGEHSEHYRMKGIPSDVIRDKANKEFGGSIKALYMYLYDGNELEFNLSSTKISFQMEKTGEILHKNKFIRKVRATAPIAK